MKPATLKANIPLFFTAEFFVSFQLVGAISVIFYRSIGINYTQLGTMWLAMAVTQAMLEVPFGVISDRIGHKRTVLLGYSFLAGGMTLIGSGTNLLLPLLGSVAWGVSAALVSGAQDAFLFETLKQQEKADAYLKMKGYQATMKSTGIMLGSIVGAYLYRFHPRSPFYLLSASMLFAVFVFSLTRSPAFAEEKSRAGQWSHLKQSATHLFSNKDLFWLTLFFCLAGFPFYGIAMMRQPFLKERFSDVVYLGYIFALIQALSSLIGIVSHRIERFLGETGSLLWTTFCIIASMILMAALPGRAATIPLIAIYAAFKFQQIILNSYSNHRIPSGQRATILSLQSMGNAALLIVLMLTSGVILDLFSIPIYLIALSGYMTLVVIPLWIFRKRFGMP